MLGREILFIYIKSKVFLKKEKKKKKRKTLL